VNPEASFPLLVPYAVYHVPADGRTPAEWYLAERGSGLPVDSRVCLGAECEAWLSLWDVLETQPGEGLVLRDRLTGMERKVHERTASETLVRNDTVLARVVSFGGHAFVNGLYPRSLSPLLAAEVEGRARGYLRRKRDVPVERLRTAKFGRYLIQRVEDEFFPLEYASAPQQLVNNDGDPILMTVDHFALAPGARAAVDERLAALTDVVGPEPEDQVPAYFFLGAEDVLLGQVTVTDSRLRLETNSRERADALRERLEQACAGLVQHRVREHSDPLSTARDAPLPDAEPPSPEASELVRALKEEHYAEWLGLPVPALGDVTPRAAVESAEGRARVALLLDEMEHSEQRLEAQERFDFDTLRRELGLLR
jgi:hypothetical protein